MARTPFLLRDDSPSVLLLGWRHAVLQGGGSVRQERPARNKRSRLLVIAGATLMAISVPSVAQALAPGPLAAVSSTAGASVDVAPDGTRSPAVAAPVMGPFVLDVPPRETPVAPPARLAIPAIGVTTGLVRLGLQDDGRLQDLEDFTRGGWYAGGPAPGSPGTALIVGHVDSYKGPSVFHRLERLRPGDPLLVTRTDGTIVRFLVDRLETYPKDRFPTDRVFGSDQPELRLITCTGRFDKTAKSYTDNLVVFATLADAGPPQAQPRPRTPHQKEPA